MDTDALRIFLKVAELQSLTATGQQLGIPKSRVSRQLRALEQQLGARLFHRSTRVVRLTADGEALLPRATRLVREADEIGALFRSGRRLRGRVRVDLPVNLARRLVLPALPDLLARHPELELFVSTTDRIVDVVREGFDCVVRVGAPEDSELVHRRLGELPMINCVSKEYAERHGVPQSLEELDRHRVVHYSSRLGTDTPTFEWVEGGKTRHRPMAASVTVNNTDAYAAACLAGLGIVQIPLVGQQAHLASGVLVEVLPERRCAPMPVSILHTHGRRAPARVRVVLNWIAHALRELD
ncbi:MAG: LysR family transcriptional regulator [Myxococcales bacterium]|nr:LysR family transcriptional regulator [Myxococcales bacterium]MCB9754159.1 LysR family transcriptional regulator [Myxococcales bacterium]